MEKSIFLAAYFLSLFITLSIFFYAWRHRHVQGTDIYAWYVLGQSLWTFGYILELLAITLSGKIFWDSVQWIAGIIITIAFPVFTVRYANFKLRKSKLLFRLSLIVPFLFFIALITDTYHHLLYPNPHLDESVIFSALTYDFTWVVYVYALYSYLVTLTGLGFLLRRFVRPHRIYRRQILTVTIGFLFPIIFTVLTIIGVVFKPFRDVSPFTFAVGNLIVSWGLFRYKLFDVIPIARDLVFENIEDLVIVLDAQDRIVDINQKALDALNMKASQVVGQSVQKIYASIPDVLETFKKPDNIHMQVALKLGEKTFHYEVVSTILYNKRERFIGRVFVANDITEHVALQGKLKTLNNELEERVRQRTAELSRITERYRAVVEHQTEFIVRWKPDRTRTFINEAYCHYFGLTHEEAMNTDFISLVYEEDRSMVLDNISNTRDSDKNTKNKGIHRVIRADGTIGWNEWIDTPIRDKNGEIIEYQSVGRDITERVQTERALAYSEEKFYKAFNTTPVMMSVEDNKGIFIDVNQSFLDTLGFRKDQVIGRRASELNFTYSLTDLIALQKESRKEGTLKDFETRIKKKSGELGIILLSSDDFYMDGVKHTVTSGLDITDRKQAEKKLIETYDITLEGWAKALELRDQETEGHTRRVTELTVKIARKYGIPAEEINDYRRGAILHDIGKLAIADNILLKPGKLNHEEWQIMSQHPWLGYKLLAPITFLNNSLDIVLHHHEKWDGSGYPKGLQRENIPLSARIFAVVDVWDAVQSDRPYKKAWPKEEAIALIKEGVGTHFDPAIVDIFLNMVETGEIDRH